MERLSAKRRLIVVKQPIAFVILPITFLLFTCANDIKGEKGDTGAAGQDAALSQYVRIHRPGFRRYSNTQVAVDASPTSPAIFKLGNEIITSEAMLLCDFSARGPGGLRDGLSMKANTVYYLYGIKNGSVAGLIADTNPPTEGPKDITPWTYLGAFPTLDTTDIVVLADFVSSGGKLIDSGYFQDIRSSATSESQAEAKFTVNVPTTAKFTYWRLDFWTIGQVGDMVSLQGKYGVDHVAPLRYRALVLSDTPAYGWIPQLEEQTAYLSVVNAGGNAATARAELQGWIEDPMEYP